MSKIYDALIQAAKNSDSRAAVFRSSTDQKVALPRQATLGLNLAMAGRMLECAMFAI